ncbi:MAG TPA: FAD-dependent oxidoreductase [Actinomycetota bacterium]|nr:FAD-dependent oxidoreductase [Actinomycetota bacterium]
MADLPTRAQTVIVGAGIVGASAAYHLADLGVTDVLVLDQGPLFATGGSTSHAPGLVFQTNGSRTMCRIAQDSVALYDTLDVDGEPVWYGVGGLELATTPERLAELKRRQGYARSWGIEGTELLSPAECAERSPLLDPSTVLGGYWIPSDGAGKGVKIVEALARRAQAAGVRFEGGVTVTGFDTEGGRIHAVETARGRIECERVLLCAGLWGPTIGAMAGVPIPLVAVQHQLVWTDPVPELASLDGDTWAQQPIVRHQDLSLYFRQRDDHFGVGNYRHEPIVTPQAGIRTPGQAMQPSLMPFTPEDFDLCEAETGRLFPALRGRMRPSDPARSLNGMFSFTPDAGSVVGESAAVRNVWVCEAVWVTHAAGMARQAVEWMVQGEPTYDLAEADANRFYPFQTTAPYVVERGKQQYREVYDILHPRQQPSKPRNLRLTPFYRQHAELGASFITGAGWERPQWFDANRDLVGGVTHEWARRSGWAAREWSPTEGAEHLAVRANAGLFDLTAYVKLRVQGPDALAFLERVCANRIDRPVGTVVYTAMLTRRGSIRCDLTVTRHADDVFLVVTGGGSGMHDLAWLRAQVRDGERVRIFDGSSRSFVLGLFGPKARDVLAAASAADVGNEAIPYMTGREIEIGEVPVFAQRISYVGELGWELYGPFEMGGRVWDLLWEAGREHGLIAAGLGAFDSLRLEKGYRLWGQDIGMEYDPISAGLGFAVKWDKDFQGREALERIRDDGPPKRLSAMTLDDPRAVVLGKEPIWRGDGVVSYVTSANYGFSIGKGIVYGYLPSAIAQEGTPVEVEYFGERIAATVAADPLFDPKGARLKG